MYIRDLLYQYTIVLYYTFIRVTLTRMSLSVGVSQRLSVPSCSLPNRTFHCVYFVPPHARYPCW